MLVHYLYYREIGYHSSKLLTYKEISRRIYSIRLSKYKDIISSHNGSINSLDLDQSEIR